MQIAQRKEFQNYDEIAKISEVRTKSAPEYQKAHICAVFVLLAAIYPTATNNNLVQFISEIAQFVPFYCTILQKMEFRDL